MEDGRIQGTAIINAIAGYIKRHPEIKDSRKSDMEILSLSINERVDEIIEMEKLKNK